MPVPRKGSYDGWEQVAETRQVFEAELMALRLREGGIDAEVLDQSFKQEPLPNVRSFSVVRVLVPAEQVTRARELLERPIDLPETATDEPESEH
jgi:putative signal transducing protein